MKLRTLVTALALVAATAAASECESPDEKMDAIDALILEASQGRWYGALLIPTREADTFEVLACSMDDDEKCCDAVLKVDDGCRITVVRLEGHCERFAKGGG